MAGNGQRTVVSLKRFEELQDEYNSLAVEHQRISVALKECEARVRKLRPELYWFADQMEDVLRYHDKTKGDTYRQIKAGVFADKILKCMAQIPGVMQGDEELQDDRVLRIAVSMANYSMMIGVNTMAAAGKLKL